MGRKSHQKKRNLGTEIGDRRSRSRERESSSSAYAGHHEQQYGESSYSDSRERAYYEAPYSGYPESGYGRSDFGQHQPADLDRWEMGTSGGSGELRDQGHPSRAREVDYREDYRQDYRGRENSSRGDDHSARGHRDDRGRDDRGRDDRGRDDRGRDDRGRDRSRSRDRGRAGGSSGDKPSEEPDAAAEGPGKAKAKSGIFGYLGIKAPPGQADSKGQAALSVNKDALRRVMEGDKRSGDKYDARRLENAQRLLDRVGTSDDRRGAGSGYGGGVGGGGGSNGSSGSVYGGAGRRTEYGWDAATSGESARGGKGGEPVHLKTVSSVTRGGVMLKDGFSHGVRPDVSASKALPYVCDACGDSGRASFLTATQLSDHLKSRHGVSRHPSLIRPKKGKPAADTEGLKL